MEKMKNETSGGKPPKLTPRIDRMKRMDYTV
jgi:hypothetical protein